MILTSGRALSGRLRARLDAHLHAQGGHGEGQEERLNEKKNIINIIVDNENSKLASMRLRFPMIIENIISLSSL